MDKEFLKLEAEQEDILVLQEFKSDGRNDQHVKHIEDLIIVWRYPHMHSKGMSLNDNLLFYH